jgi:chitinase
MRRKALTFLVACRSHIPREAIRSINGSIECDGGNASQVQSRIARYQRFCALLGVSPGANLAC